MKPEDVAREFIDHCHDNLGHYAELDDSRYIFSVPLADLIRREREACARLVMAHCSSLPELHPLVEAILEGEDE